MSTSAIAAMSRRRAALIADLLARGFLEMGQPSRLHLPTAYPGTDRYATRARHCWEMMSRSFALRHLDADTLVIDSFLWQIYDQWTAQTTAKGAPHAAAVSE
jgi:hypothetical protein